jgi:hypothetical protein
MIFQEWRFVPLTLKLTHRSYISSLKGILLFTKLFMAIVIIIEAPFTTAVIDLRR